MRYARLVAVPRCLPAASTPVRSRRVGSSAILVSLLATALGLSAPQVTAAAASEPPVINMVKVTGTPAEPLLLVSGENFGSEQPSPTYPPGPCPERGTGLLFGQSFIFHDETREWTAGEGGEEGGGNCVGLSVVKWTTSNVEFRFGNDYLGANGQWTLEPGDSYQVTLYGVSHTGVAKYVELPKFPLAVADTGTGKGTVSSEPKGIECESVEPLTRCTEEFDEKAKLNLTATPAAGSKFVRWSAGPCEGSEASTCEFEMPGQATKVTAEFAKLLPKFLLTVSDTGTGNGTVSSEPKGIQCESVVPLSKCTEGFEEKTKVKLTATPAGGSKFVKWSGGPCVGSAVPTCEFAMPNKATKVKVEFAQLPTVWLCQPGLANNPCESDLTTTVQLPNGSSFVEHSKPAKNPPIDCFYLYPQVSSQNTLNASLEIDPEETQAAIDQASRFSQVCKVYAPMYPQFTVLGALFEGITPGGAMIAYDGALAAWRYYLANYNHGRGVVLIGHSLGASTLKQLIKEQIDPNPALRHRLVSADLTGGQVTVPVGKDVGGDFQHVPACHAAWQTECVVAYSSFLKEPPEESYLGRVASPYFKTEPNSSLEILCVNPAALFGGDRFGHSEGDALGGSHGDHSMSSHGDQSGLLLPYQSTSPFPGILGSYWQVPKALTPWVSTPGQYSAQCKHANGASWLQLSELPYTGPAPDPRLQIAETLGPLWGTHLVNVNIALGNLVDLTAVQSWAYQAHRHDGRSGHGWGG